MYGKSLSHIFPEVLVLLFVAVLGYDNLVKVVNLPCHFKEFFEKKFNYINKLFKYSIDLK